VWQFRGNIDGQKPIGWTVFEHTHVYRVVDKERNTLVYLAIGDKVIKASPQNSISTVPIMP
jgi:CreA protein